MENTNGTSAQERFNDRFFAWANDILDSITGHPLVSLAVVCVFVFAVVWLVKSRKIRLESLGPIKFSEGAQKGGTGRKFPKRITTLPAPRPKNPNIPLPPEIETLILELKSKQRKHILIQCGSQDQAEEWGKRLYHRLDKEKICDHIGWLRYETGETGKPLIEECIDQEFSIYAEIEDYSVRRAKRLDFLDNYKQHTVLFVNVIDYHKEKDRVLERYNNFKGLSMILLSRKEIEGYETYPMAKDRGELSCSSKN